MALHVPVANMALSHLGLTTKIEAADEDSVAASEMRSFWDHARKQTLKAYDWGFARKRITLETDTEAPPDEWAYRYKYPVNCIAIRRIINPLGEDAAPIPYLLELNETGERNTILTNAEEARARITFANPPVELYSPHFELCISHLLAHYTAVALTGKRAYQKDQGDLYRANIVVAGAHDAREDREPERKDAEWITARA